jgi:hypothetical protein
LGVCLGRGVCGVVRLRAKHSARDVGDHREAPSRMLRPHVMP